MKKSIVSLSLAIKKQRKLQSLNQQELADLSGTSLNFISQLESGKQTVRLNFLLSVLHILGLEFQLQRGKSFISISKEIEE